LLLNANIHLGNLLWSEIVKILSNFQHICVRLFCPYNWNVFLKCIFVAFKFVSRLWRSKKFKWESPGNPHWRERLSTVHLLIKKPFFKENYSFSVFIRANLNWLVQGGQLYWVLPFSKDSLESLIALDGYMGAWVWLLNLLSHLFYKLGFKFCKKSRMLNRFIGQYH